ncbi:hypothetical protein [Litorihabitans aurantiacus]|uniref:Uncharacterized protein n=1 Tax=Litorihabitans aurantiacus TaxID=1930061 RepID=A0AA37XHV6_9MICO|nr:hypothetical protein [Litorihabitans aurantiacus]GMA33525.1 hypothetical protein GCM10025875_35170 [Litorihabitans aurantiacus]GMA33622.1 hypothetical protein GCM10025875_36140 [Litorihabitans aurantiacus]
MKIHPSDRKVEKCMRCRRRYRGHGEWNLQYDLGREVGVLCPDCQTPEENAEAVINEATIDYAKTVEMTEGEFVVRDLIRRSEEAAGKVARAAVAAGDRDLRHDDVIREVKDGLPARYPGTITQRDDMIRRIVTDVLSGDLYEDAP